MHRELVKLDNQLRFINEVASANLVVSNHTEASLSAELASRGYPEHSAEQSTGQRKENVSNRGYDYLLALPIRTFTKDRVPALPPPPH